jgi:hypothetical protein
MRSFVLVFLLGAGSFSAPAALAAPISYHVDVDASSQSGAGWLDFYFSPTTVAPAVVATLSHFSANVGPVDAGVSGDYSIGPGGTFSLTNGPGFNYLSRMVTLGGVFSFDLGFDGAFLTSTGAEGSLFSVALLDHNAMAIGNPDGVAIFALPGTSPATIVLGIDREFASVSEAVSAVPEPGTWLLIMSGLIALAALRPRRASR